MSRSGGFSLVPLECESCGASISAEGQDVVYYCSACRNGYRYDPHVGGLASVEVDFLSRPDVEVDLYKPFWLLPAKIEIAHRDAKSATFSGILDFFFGSDRDGEGSGSGRFAVPAFQVAIGRAIDLCRRYSAEMPRTRTKLGERLVGGIYDVTDAQKMARYAVMASEVDKPDLLRDLRIEIEFGQPGLIGVPFVENAGVIKDVFFNLEI